MIVSKKLWKRLEGMDNGWTTRYLDGVQNAERKAALMDMETMEERRESGCDM